MNETKQSWFIPEDVRQEVREMHEDGLTYPSIAHYMGLSISSVQNICDREAFKKRKIKWLNKGDNRKKAARVCKEYITRTRFSVRMYWRRKIQLRKPISIAELIKHGSKVKHADIIQDEFNRYIYGNL